MLDVKNFSEVYASFTNFRDICLIPNKYSKSLKIREGLIFRSSSLSKYSPEDVVNFLKQNDIKRVLDLRGIKEIQKYHNSIEYEEELKQNYVVHIPFEPKVNFYIPNDFYTNFYYAVLKDYGEQIKFIFQDYIAQAFINKMIIHCEWGKDRTGIIIALLLDLLGVKRDYIIKDYLLSEMDTKRRYVEFVLEIIDKEFDGIINYLTGHCKIPLHTLNMIKIKLAP
ncbi:MAG: hypothetical protein EU535_03590 [Promethearchaeota archaeon]|nr:MAG: hypothetical protein EU535_03590 [Candidatus Lokiarchaeota archaeon]